MATLVRAAETGSTSYTFPDSVAVGDFLCLAAIGGQYSSMSGTYTSASDSANGSWTTLYNSGQYNPPFTVWGAFAYVFATTATSANGTVLTINANLDWGGYMIGHWTSLGNTIVGHSEIEEATTGGSTPSVNDSNTGDLVIGWFATYSAATIAAGTGATLDASDTGSQPGTGGLLHLTAGSVSGANSVQYTCTSNSASTVAGTVIIAGSAIVPGVFSVSDPYGTRIPGIH